ncbi:MAG TPA: hypothetical protein PLI45_00170 [Candidatus Woesebacteria bacterium]|nr:hypothetical protein [Candidatus Woesebacteria bacterium]
MPSILPEFWKQIHFGENIDVYGGRRGPDILMAGVAVSKDMGLVNFLMSKNGYDVLAEDAGIALFYQKDGKLAQAGFDVDTFVDACGEEIEEVMGGDALKEILAQAVEENCQISVCVDIEAKTAAIAYIDNESGESKVINDMENIEPNNMYLMKSKFGDYVLNVEFLVVEDVLRFGILATPEGKVITENTKILMTEVLTECNFETFLDSSSLDKYNRLAKRIFLLND